MERLVSQALPQDAFSRTLPHACPGPWVLVKASHLLQPKSDPGSAWLSRPPHLPRLSGTPQTHRSSPGSTVPPENTVSCPCPAPAQLRAESQGSGSWRCRGRRGGVRGEDTENWLSSKPSQSKLGELNLYAEAPLPHWPISQVAAEVRKKLPCGSPWSWNQGSCLWGFCAHPLLPPPH